MHDITAPVYLEKNSYDIKYKEDLPIVTGEYLYYKGIIRGLSEAEGKSKQEISSLKNIYSIKTKKIDILIGENNERR